MLNYEIISSGSIGNSVRIENVLIDCGVAYNKLKETLYDVDVLLLTHIHGDHIVPSTLNRIKKMFPNITIIGNYEVAQKYGVDIICNVSNITIGDISITPFELVHDVICTGYVLHINGTDVVYATDTSSMVNCPKMKFDYIFLEANYDEGKAREITDWRKRYKYNPMTGFLRHLSKQQCKAFYFVNRKSANSILIELHKSARFY